VDFDRVVAVLTGDIVDSSGLQRVDQRPVSVLIEHTGQQLNHNFRSAIHSQIDIFRGDSWQLIVLDPASAFRIGLFFRALLRAEYGIDSRVSIGYGQYDFLPGESISTGTGQAFTLSGQGLEACRKPTRMVLSFPDGNLPGDILGLRIITQLIDLQAGRWTPGQSQAVAGALLKLTQAEIAAGWKPEAISQQAISQHLDNAGWIQINHALGYLEGAIPEILD
jgi:hypothetical protein